MARTSESRKAKVKPKTDADPKQQDLLVDKLEGYLSETVPYVAQSLLSASTTVLNQHPRKTLNQAKRYLRDTVPPKAKSAHQFLKHAYDNATMKYFKNKASSAGRFVKNHPYTSGLFGFGLFTAGLINPTASLAIGAGLVGKTVYDRGGLNIEVDTNKDKVVTKARSGARKPK